MPFIPKQFLRKIRLNFIIFCKDVLLQCFFPDFFVYAGILLFFTISTNFPDFYVVFVIFFKIPERSA